MSVSLRELRARWVSFVGPQIGACTRPDTVYGRGCLTIIAQRSPLTAELERHGREILRRLPEIDGERITSLAWSYEEPAKPARLRRAWNGGTVER